jgi:uncharacterized protein (TIGR03083 family)
MQLTPRYEGAPVLAFDPAPGDPSIPLLRQRRRLGAMLATLDDSQWAAPSRCAGWTCRDVVRHLVTVNSFWMASVEAGRRGEPTRYLTDFDPVATSAQLVGAARDGTTAELLGSYLATTDALATAFAGLDGDGWELLAEAPPGHVSLAAVALHALWDGWVHERDIALPLGLDVVVEPDEVAGSLRYVVGLGPALLATTGSERTGVFAVRAVDPDVDLVVDVGTQVVVRDGRLDGGTTTLTGGGADLLESFSLRSAPPTLPDPEAWMLAGLARAFDQAV